MPESALPLGVYETTIVLLIGQVAHRHQIVHTTCGFEVSLGTMTEARDAEAFCATCFAIPKLYGGGKHRLEKPWGKFKLWFNTHFYRNNSHFVGRAKVQ